MRTFAAVDLGAQSGRVAVGRFDGEALAVEVLHRFPNEPVRAGGTLHWDVLRLYHEALAGLRRAGAVDSVGVDSWAVDFGLVDRAGRLLGNPVHYRDGRRAEAMRAALERVPRRELYERTGIQLLAINTVFELAAMAAEQDPALAAAHRLLLVPDLFAFWLCGSETTEFTNATTTGCLDARTHEWTSDLLGRLDVPAGIFPEVVPPGTRLGATETGTPVVATATHDTAAAVAAVPLQGEGGAYLSIGTWSLVGVESSEPVVSDAAYDANLTNEGGVEGTTRVLRNVTGLWLLHECRRAWAAAGSERTYDELVGLAAQAPPFGPLIDPDDPSFAEPGDMPARIAAYCTETGQDAPAGEAAVVRCILESLAVKQAATIDALAAATARDIDTLHVVGGGASNELLCAWTAAAAGRPVLAGPVEATLVGNLLVQAIALGELASVAEGRELVRRSFSPAVYEPDAEPAWHDARERFASLGARRETVGVVT
jgi:rhamnulokinase